MTCSYVLCSDNAAGCPPMLTEQRRQRSAVGIYAHLHELDRACVLCSDTLQYVYNEPVQLLRCLHPERGSFLQLRVFMGGSNLLLSSSACGY